MSSFADRAMEFARHGFVAVSIDYRCEGPLRKDGDNFHPWFDAVEDARAAVRYMIANSARLQLDPHRIVAFGGSAGAVTVAQMLHALPDGSPMPPPVPPPPMPPSKCELALQSHCNLTSFKTEGGYDACLACTRLYASAPTCRPAARAAYCNGTGQPSMLSGTEHEGPASALVETGVSNISCGIALSGAVTPGSIAAKQVVASASSPPYLDFHGTQDRTVPYDWALADGSNTTWGDAIDTKSWLDRNGAPNYLCSIQGAGHVPFGSLYEAPYATTFFGFLLQAMNLKSVPCPKPFV
eukprot:COSAG02_NODE_7041_length_3214_cov_1.509470_2_plen_296_part_00